MDREIPAGRYWCPRCFAKSEFIVAEDASPEDPECPLECFACGYIHDKVTEECDPKTGVRHPVPVVRPAIPREQREAARAEMRETFRKAVVRDGVRLESFARRRPR